MREKTLEHRFVMEVKRAGGLALKLVSPGFDGMPDRLLLMDGGRAAFVEVKAPGKKPRPLQRARHQLLRRMGFHVFVLDEESQIPRIIAQMEGRDVP